MSMALLVVSAVAATMWLGMALLPWRPWSTRESLDAGSPSSGGESLEDVTVVIPARNEAKVIAETLRGVAAQGRGMRVVLVDDGSADDTARRARDAAEVPLEIVPAEPLPPGWTGKLWALEQGRRRVTTTLTLLLDADIALSSGIVAAMRRTMHRDGVPFVSLTAAPSFATPWEKLLMPAFVYFFKALYPFRLANTAASRVAAAAGGCILMETRLFAQIGGLGSIRSALIDDCALARAVKESGNATWLGLTRSVRSIRPYVGLRGIWNMVARTAYTQLRYSPAMLALCTLAMLLAFAAPLAALAAGPPPARWLSGAATAAMAFTYLPVQRFYGRSWALSLTLPLAAMLFLAMTWTSAVRYWRGDRSRWKGRVYGAAMETTGDAGG